MAARAATVAVESAGNKGQRTSVVNAAAVPAGAASGQRMAERVQAVAVTSDAASVRPERATDSGEGARTKNAASEAALVRTGETVAGIVETHDTIAQREGACIVDAAAAGTAGRTSVANGQPGQAHRPIRRNVADTAAGIAADGQIRRSRAGDDEIIGDNQFAVGERYRSWHRHGEDNGIAVTGAGQSLPQRPGATVRAVRDGDGVRPRARDRSAEQRHAKEGQPADARGLIRRIQSIHNNSVHPSMRNSASNAARKIGAPRSQVSDRKRRFLTWRKFWLAAAQSAPWLRAAECGQLASRATRGQGRRYEHRETPFASAGILPKGRFLLPLRGLTGKAPWIWSRGPSSCDCVLARGSNQLNLAVRPWPTPSLPIRPPGRNGSAGRRRARGVAVSAKELPRDYQSPQFE